MIVLFTDFGLHGPYVGQMKAGLHQMVPGTSVIDLFADAPVGSPKASAYVLAAYAPWFPAGTVFLCVVDPGVSGVRPPIVLEADRRWYVGPANGLLELVERRCQETRSWHIDWKPERLSASFHGRDLFAPVAAHLYPRTSVRLRFLVMAWLALQWVEASVLRQGWKHATCDLS